MIAGRRIAGMRLPVVWTANGPNTSQAPRISHATSGPLGERAAGQLGGDSGEGARRQDGAP